MDKLKFLLLFVLIALMSACSKDEYESRLPQLVINDLEFSSDNGEQSMSFPGEDFKNYSASANESWCDARIDFDASKILIKVYANDTYDDRSCIVTISDIKDELATRSFKVVQKQKDAIIIKGDSFTVPEEGGEVAIDVKSNVNYIVEILSSVNWLREKKSATRGLTESKIVLSADKNNSGDERNAVLVIKDNDSRNEFSIKINQPLTPYIDVDKEEFILQGKETNIEILVQTNIELKTIINTDWVMDVGRDNNGNQNFTQKLYINAFSGHLSRSTSIILQPQNNKWKISKTIKITQKKDLVYIAKEVDLGLSVYWSAYNLGATVPEENGDYFSWGEIRPKDSYSEDSYLFYDNYFIDEINGTKYDAAKALLGGNWRMPTKKELYELSNNCEWKETKVNNVKGYKVTGKNGNSIFIPGAGLCVDNYLNSGGTVTYWTSSTSEYGENGAWCLYGRNPTCLQKYYGLPIRPVKSK